MKKYAAELIGTFVLVFGGVGSAVLAGPKIGRGGPVKDLQREIRQGSSTPTTV